MVLPKEVAAELGPHATRVVELEKELRELRELKRVEGERNRELEAENFLLRRAVADSESADHELATHLANARQERTEAEERALAAETRREELEHYVAILEAAAAGRADRIVELTRPGFLSGLEL